MVAREHIQRLFNWKTAFAELLVIVAGVLLALAVDRWAETRRDEVTAREYMSRLRADLETDQRAWALSADWSRSIDQSAVWVLDVYRGRNPGPEEYDQLALHIFRGSWGMLLGDTSTTYDDLVSTGNIGLLPVDVRNAITEYQSRKKLYLVDRQRVLENKGTEGYWRVPAMVLGPELTPRAWLEFQGHTPDYLVEQGTLGLDSEDAIEILTALRSIPDLEVQLAEIRHAMAQRSIIFGERLPSSARALDELLIRYLEDSH